MILFPTYSFSNHYNKPGNAAVPLQDAAIGDFCVARFSEDNFWYRARVVLKRGTNSIDQESVIMNVPRR